MSSAPATTTQLVEGSAAIANAMVAAGCRFFTGYPMTPFTEVLEHMAEQLPEVDGVCINAESELEAVGMVWGAAAAGCRAATGSTGQGLSLMQESIAEAALAGIGFVVLNMARGQGDYFQATRGGGHGDYRTPVLAPSGPAEITELIADAFDLATEWRNPVVVVGDYYMAHTWVDIEVADTPSDPPPPPAWALDGSTGGTGAAKLVSPLGTTKQRDGVGYDLSAHYEHCARQREAMAAGIEPRAELIEVDDADLVQKLQDAGLCRRTGQALVDQQRLGQLLVERVQRIERGHRLLKDEADVIAPDLAQQSLIGANHLLPRVFDRPRGRRAIGQQVDR